LWIAPTSRRSRIAQPSTALKSGRRSRQHHLHPRWMVNPPSQPFPKEKRRPGLALRPYRYRRCRPQLYSFRNGNLVDGGRGTEICRRL
jgi:hypothetical protein